MMRTSIPLNNFASGQVDRDLKGRYDIPLTLNGHEIARNFMHSLKGCVLYRPGMKFMDEISYSALYPFEFNSEQSYLLAFDNEYITFYSYYQTDDKFEFVKVTKDNGEVLKVKHPYGSERFNLHLTQNCDVAYINHIGAKFPEYKLKRTVSNNFTLEKTDFTNKNNDKPSLSNASAKTNHGYPGISVFYENRLHRVSSSVYPTYIYGSKGGDYDNITTGTESNDGYQFDLAESNSRPYWAISGANSLLVGTPEGVLTVNGGSTTQAITPTNISAKLSCRDKCSSARPVRKDNYVFYISKNKRKLFMFEYDTLMEQFKATCLSKANYEITKGGMSKLALKSDRFDLMYAVCDGKLLTVCFSNDEGINSWSEWNTKGEIVDICSVTRPDGDDDLLIEVKRKINGQEKYFLEKLSDVVEFARYENFVETNKEDEDKKNYYRYIAEQTRQCNYLDCSVEYSGLQKNKLTFNPEDKTITVENEIFKPSDINRRIWVKTITGKEYGIFDILKVIDEKKVEVNVCQCNITTVDEWYISATVFSGLEHLEGETVSVVGNGGYIGDFNVKDGKVDISSANTKQVATAVIGLPYQGMLKSCNLGVNLAQQGTQTFTDYKNIFKVEFMFSFSAGGKVGDSLYRLEDIQDFNPQGLYDSPALLMDSTDKNVLLNGNYDKEKHYYIVQDKPLPLQIDMIVPYYKHSIK